MSLDQLVKRLVWLSLAILLVGFVAGLVLSCMPAQAQSLGEPLDPQTAAIIAALQKPDEGFDWGKLLSGGSPLAAAGAVLYGLKQIAPMFGRDPAAEAGMARLDERTRETRREQRRMRRTLHWHGNILTVIAAKVKADLPEAPQPVDDGDGDDSDDK